MLGYKSNTGQHLNTVVQQPSLHETKYSLSQIVLVTGGPDTIVGGQQILDLAQQIISVHNDVDFIPVGVFEIHNPFDQLKEAWYRQLQAMTRLRSQDDFVYIQLFSALADRGEQIAGITCGCYQPFPIGNLKLIFQSM